MQALKDAKDRAEESRQYAWDNQAKIYQERDLLVGVLARLYPSHRMKNTRNGKESVCIHSPAGQLAWTVHSASESLREAISALPLQPNDWDGAKTLDRLERLKTLANGAYSKKGDNA